MTTKSNNNISEEILKRREVLSSHIILGKYFSRSIINELFKLFDKTNNTPSIIDYLESVRNEMGLNRVNVEITSKLYTINPKSKNDSRQGLHLQIKRDGVDFLHLSLFITPVHTGNKTQGMIHFSKNIYVSSKRKLDKSLAYAIIKVEDRPPHSLHFIVGTGQNTIGLPNVNKYDKEIKQEMEAILITLNRLFDEHHEWYIGRSNNTEIHMNVNNTLYLMQHKKLPYQHNQTKTQPFMKIETNFPFHSLLSKPSTYREHTKRKKHTPNRETRKKKRITS
jgi:hypothetical protein